MVRSEYKYNTLGVWVFESRPPASRASRFPDLAAVACRWTPGKRGREVERRGAEEGLVPARFEEKLCRRCSG
jgi:hypothetical protein